MCGGEDGLVSGSSQMRQGLFGREFPHSASQLPTEIHLPPPTRLHHRAQYFHLGSEHGRLGAGEESSLPAFPLSQGQMGLEERNAKALPFTMERRPVSLPTPALLECAPYWPVLSLESPARSRQPCSLRRNICCHPWGLLRAC